MLIKLLKNDVTFQGDLNMATEIIDKFKSNHILDLDGYVNKTNLDRMHSSLQPSHGLIRRRINSLRLWSEDKKVEREIK